jgi:hypothetical protein
MPGTGRAAGPGNAVDAPLLLDLTHTYNEVSIGVKITLITLLRVLLFSYHPMQAKRIPTLKLQNG